jgi:ABC-type multidrug transport system fused ATPase/permease subunit
LALLQRFYEPTAGKITIGGVDIRSLDMATVRGMMGYVSQEAVLFPGTIRYNLTVSFGPVFDYRLLTWKAEMVSM